MQLHSEKLAPDGHYLLMPKPDYISVGLPWPDEIVADVPSPSTPPRPAVASSLPPAPLRPAVVHAVRRTLHLGSLGGIQPMQSRNHNASRRSSCSRGSSIARDLLLPTQVERDRGADRIFTLPDATCCPTQGPIHIAIRIRLLSRSPPPAKVFSRGILLHHATYKGRKPISYVDTGIYEDGRHNYYEAFIDEDLTWASCLDYVLRRHRIPRFQTRG